MMIDPAILERITLNTGEKLAEISENQPVLLVFLRHFGCVFCKEALSDIQEKREEIEAKGARIIFVHMAENEIADKYFEAFKLTGLTHISDPNQEYYKAFRITKGSFSQLYGLRTWVRGYAANKKNGFKLEVSKQLGDSTQMPGIFLLQNREIKQSYIHRMASDRPDYLKLVETCCQPSNEKH